jgi:tripartite-type tricarboxylate transporter receptor subunit TctC
MKRLLAVLLLIPTLAFAWEPSKPVIVVIGNAPGAGNEIAFRKLASIISEKKMSTVKFVIENKPGADSVIGMNYVYEATPNGYTAGIPSHMSTFVTNDIWEKKIKKFDYNSFEYVVTMGKSPLALVAWPNSKVNTPIDFVKLISTTDRPINVAIGGGAHRMAYEYLMVKGNGKRDMVKFIKFQGPLQAVTSVASLDAGNTEFGIMPIAVAHPLADAGKVKIIGFTGDRKLAQYPNVPFLNSVAPGINVYAAWSIALPPKTPKDVVAWYNKQFVAAMRTKEYKEWCDQNLVFIDERELTPKGVNQQTEDLRATFLPMQKYISAEGTN